MSLRPESLAGIAPSPNLSMCHIYALVLVSATLWPYILAILGAKMYLKSPRLPAGIYEHCKISAEGIALILE